MLLQVTVFFYRMKVVVWLAIFVVALFEGIDQRALADDESRHYVNEVAVQVEGDDLIADLVAETHGFRVKRKVGPLKKLE